MRLIRLVVSAAVLLTAAKGATLLSENFDELTPALSATSVGAFSTLNGTNVDIVGGATFGSLCVAPEANNCVDLDGTNGLSQGVLQTVSGISLVPGMTYLLSFDLIGSQRGVTASTTVTLGTSGCSGAGCLYNQTFNLTSGDVTSGIVSNAVITVTSPTTAYLTFTSNTAGEIGDLLDNVTLTSAAASGSPEPSTMLLTGSALLGVALITRRLRRL